MGCVSSALLNQDDDFSQIGASSAFSHHIVSLTSTTYGLLTLDAPPSPSSDSAPKMVAPQPPLTPTPHPPPPRVTLGSLFPSPLSEPRSHRYQPFETINSWDLMSGLDSDHVPSFRFTPLKNSNSYSNTPLSNQIVTQRGNDENMSPNVCNLLKQASLAKDLNRFLEGFETICPPNGENKVVLYTTTLRGVRKTFEDCNAVRSAIQGLGISICERDISMDRGFREELKEMMKGKGNNGMVPPRLFVKGRYIGGAEEVMKIVEDGCISELVQGLPKLTGGHVCDGCGGVGFLPCFMCHGSCKIVMVVTDGLELEEGMKDGKKSVVVRCSECNENGLVLCPICS